ncbi:hypothetical protein CAPTEDRAFT_206347 [Capitella teleta]|uniref:G-protein coupled receptors family 1 profile domain-containing protein n=1 Tax=Capitella teleta TaxID=283909 RepID=R7UIP9_CAPTE|nr:hypothetical protein CAPTEDRAFT_206347 [Capitella teleta]|eukprot:ELU03673.1 hypothetical protein CAPTEDRAFT_206347 [Capitella teleta]
MRPRYDSLADEIITWIICVLALLSNTLTIYTMVKTKQGIGLDTSTNPCSTQALTSNKKYSRRKESVIISLGFLYFLGMGSSLYMLLAVAVDRLVAITKPLVYRTYLTDARIKGIMVMIWSYMAFVASWIFVYCGLQVPPGAMLRTFMPMDVLPKRISDYVLMPHMYFAVLANGVVYILVYQNLKKLRSEAKQGERRSLQRNRRFFRMVVATIVAQLTLWAPYTLVYNLVDINRENSPQYLTHYVQPFVYAVTLCNNWINPLLYCALNKDYRMAYLKALGRRGRITNVAPASVRDSTTRE